MGNCFPKAEEKVPDDNKPPPTPAEEGEAFVGRHLPNNHIFPPRHYVPFKRPNVLSSQERQQFDLLFMVQLSRLRVHLRRGVSAFCSITWDYEQFQTDVVKVEAGAPCGWDDHVFRYQCNRQRLEKAEVSIEVYEYIPSGSPRSRTQKPSPTGTGCKYRQIGSLTIPLSGIVNGPWRVDHRIVNVDNENVGRIKFRCRVQALQRLCITVSNIHAYINRRQAAHIVSVAKALEDVHTVQSECLVIDDDNAGVSCQIASAQTSARLDLLSFDKTSHSKTIAQLLKAHQKENGANTDEFNDTELCCETYMSIEEPHTLTRFLETVMVIKIALPVRKQEQKEILQERRRSSHTSMGAHRIALVTAFDLEAEEPTPTSTPTSTPTQAQKELPDKTQPPQPRHLVKPSKKPRISQRTRRRLPTLPSDTSALTADAKVPMTTIYSSLKNAGSDEINPVRC